MPAQDLGYQWIPYGELKPDGKLFNNDGLEDALNVVPVYGNYVASQLWSVGGDKLVGDEPYGLHVHFAGGSTWYPFVGTDTALYQGTSALAFLAGVKTRAAGGAYNAAANDSGWQSTSFGDAVIMTDYIDDPQLLTSPAAANFVKLAQSGDGNPGMDPKAKFVFPVRNNLFLANCNLAAGFDTLPSGANPTLVAWSQDDNTRQYGSYNATPALVGTGFQNLNYDLGYISGGVGGEFGLVALQKGWVRIDGPPYTFRPIVIGMGCRFPNSIIRYDGDTYFWGPSGPSVLRGGEGPVEVLGNDKISRTLIDNASGFSPSRSISSTIPIRHVGAGIDPVNGLIYWNFTSTGAAVITGYSQRGDLCVVYNVSDGRFSFIENKASSPGATLGLSGILFAKTSPDLGGAWAPGRDLVGVLRTHELPANVINYWLAMPNYGTGGTASPYLQRAYNQLDPQLTTRIRRLRPIFSLNSSVAFSLTITIESKNRPYDNPVTFTYTDTERDSHGWVTTPDTKLADFHRVSTLFTSDLPVIAEMEGFEVEYEKGGSYAV